MRRNVSNVNYDSLVCPPDYKCDKCGAHGVRLYRDYQTFADHTRLLCTKCTIRSQKFNAIDDNRYGLYGDLNDPKNILYQIKWMVAAVPVEGDDTYWGYTSVPQRGVIWWERLPE